MHMEELAKYGSTGVALAVIGVLFYVLKIILEKFEVSQKDQADAIRSSAEATKMISVKLDQAIKTDAEMYDLLKNLNGKLTSAIIKKAEENRK